MSRYTIDGGQFDLSVPLPFDRDLLDVIRQQRDYYIPIRTGGSLGRKVKDGDELDFSDPEDAASCAYIRTIQDAFNGEIRGGQVFTFFSYVTTGGGLGQFTGEAGVTVSFITMGGGLAIVNTEAGVAAGYITATEGGMVTGGSADAT